MEANLRAVNKNVDIIFTEVIFRANSHLVLMYRDTCQASNLLFEFKSPNVCRRHGMKTLSELQATCHRYPPVTGG